MEAKDDTKSRIDWSENVRNERLREKVQIQGVRKPEKRGGVVPIKARVRRGDDAMTGDIGCTDHKPKKRTFQYVDEAEGSTSGRFWHCASRSRTLRFIWD